MAIRGNFFFDKLEKIFTSKLNKKKFLSNLNNIFFPIISELLLKKGIKSIGYAILLKVIFLNDSNFYIWSKKLIPKFIGHKADLFDLLFLLLTDKLSNFFLFISL